MCVFFFQLDITEEVSVRDSTHPHVSGCMTVKGKPAIMRLSIYIFLSATHSDIVYIYRLKCHRASKRSKG